MSVLKVSQLRKSIKNVPDDYPVTFQGNIHSEGENPTDNPSYITCTGHVYSAFVRDGNVVMDCAITDSET